MFNFQNSTHRIYFTNPDSTSTFEINSPDSNGIVSQINGFYINLLQKFSGSYSITDTNMTLSFNYIGGILLNKLLTQFPIDINHIYGYHTIYSTTLNTFSILLDRKPYFSSSFGDNSIYVSLITNISKSYTNSNSYVINFENTFTNVISIELFDYTFPYYDYLIDSSSNTFYWQNLNDDVIYSVEFLNGKYTINQLLTELQTKINNTLYTNTIYSTSYLNQNYINISIDNTNTITFQNFIVAKLLSPIQSVSPVIPNTNLYTLTINHPSHNLQVGNIIYFSNFITSNPNVNLNISYTIISVISSNEYTIQIPNNYLQELQLNVSSGNYTFIYVPYPLKLFFNYSNTIGKQLGFRNVGADTSITNFNTIITNNDNYLNELIINTKFVYNSAGLLVPLYHNELQTLLFNYYLLKINTYQNLLNKSDYFFAKISNTSSDIKYHFKYTSLDAFDIRQLQISVYDENNNLINTNLDHSFVLKITSLDYRPLYTQINSHQSII